MKAYIGDLVLTYKHQHFGKVYQKHHSYDQKFDGQPNNNWFKLQNLAEETKKEPWYDILVHNGGAICIPESQIEKIYNISNIPSERYSMAEFFNPWNEFYFRQP